MLSKSVLMMEHMSSGPLTATNGKVMTQQEPISILQILSHIHSYVHCTHHIDKKSYLFAMVAHFEVTVSSLLKQYSKHFLTNYMTLIIHERRARMVYGGFL